MGQFQEGQTATNPQTGEKIVFRGGQWSPVGGSVSAQPQAGPVYGAPAKAEAPKEPPVTWSAMSPEEAKAMGLEPGKVWQRSSRGEMKAVGDSPVQADGAQQDAITKLRNVIDKIDQVAIDSSDNGGWFETGTTGAMARSIPGSAAYDLAGNVQTIDANAAFNALAEMRRNSPTGGALGNVTERELSLLTSSVANLDPNQSQEQFFSNLGESKKVYLEMLRRLDPAGADEYAKRKGIRYNPDGGATLFYEDGEDKREETDPFGIIQGGNGTDPNGGGGGEGPYSLSNIALGLGQGLGSVVRGAGDVVGLAANPIGQMMYDALGYDQQYDAGKILRDTAGLPANPNRTTDTIIRMATGALAGSAGANALAGSLGPGTTQNVLSIIGRTPIRDTVAGAGAGAGSEAGRASGVPGGELAGALAGGMAGYGGANALASMAQPRQANALAQAAARQGVDMLPADAGGPVARAVTTGTKASPLSVAPVVNAAQRQQGQMQTATRRAAESQGAVVDTDIAGQGVRTAAERFTRRTSERASRLYERAGEAAKGVRIKPLQTMAKLDQYIARLQADPAAPAGAVDDLTRFRQNIETGVGVTGLRDARTRLSQGVYDGKLRSGQDQAMWRDILSDLSSDIDMGLRSAGRGDAAGMFRQADTFWKGRVEHIDQVLQPILGRDRSGEQVLQAVESMARGNNGGNARLSRLLSEMTPDEAGQVRATLIERLGKAAPGAQDAEGAAYSASTFLTNWNRLTPQAKASLFSETGLRQNLNDLATLADGMKQSQAMANHSNTGVATASNVAVGTAVGLSNPAVALLGAGAQFLTGRLMASPNFARLLAKTAKMPEQAASRTFSEQIGLIAAREPLIANDIRAVQQFLMEGIGGTGRAAASPDQGPQQGQ